MGCHMKPCRDTCAKGWLEEPGVVHNRAAARLGFQHALNCEDSQLPKVQLIGSSGQPFGISDLNCMGRFLVIPHRSSTMGLLLKWWLFAAQSMSLG